MVSTPTPHFSLQTAHLHVAPQWSRQAGIAVPTSLLWKQERALLPGSQQTLQGREARRTACPFLEGKHSHPADGGGGRHGRTPLLRGDEPVPACRPNHSSSQIHFQVAVRRRNRYET